MILKTTYNLIRANLLANNRAKIYTMYAKLAIVHPSLWECTLYHIFGPFGSYNTPYIDLFSLEPVFVMFVFASLIIALIN